MYNYSSTNDIIPIINMGPISGCSFTVCIEVGMKNLTLVIVLLLMLIVSQNSNSCTYMDKCTYVDIQRVFNKMVPNSGIHEYVRLVITDSDNVASSNRGIVKISLKLLNFTKDDNELALVIGHELTHIKNLDYYRGGILSQIDKEYRADRGGLLLGLKSGYNTCKALNIFPRFILKYGNKPSSDHPRFSDRYGRLYNMCR